LEINSFGTKGKRWVVCGSCYTCTKTHLSYNLSVV